MARALRLEFEGAVYHLLGRGNARQKIFESDGDRTQFVNFVDRSLLFQGRYKGFVIDGVGLGEV